MDSDKMIKKPVNITMYRWAGKKFGITIKSECEECDINSGILKDMKQKELIGRPVIIEIKPWLTNIWNSLFRGGWHAPVVLVDRKLFSQGVVINRSKLSKLICELTK